MRKMRATTTPIHEYSNPAEAIIAGKEANIRLRTVADDQVRGRIIRSMVWDDVVLTLELEGGQYLNITAQSEGVRCSLDDRPAVIRPGPEEEVMVEFDSGEGFVWRRAEVARKFVGQPLMRLWFGEDMLFVYAPHIIFMCSLIVASDDGSPRLYWDESE